MVVVARWGVPTRALPEAGPVALNHRQAPTNPSASSPSGSELTHRDPPHPIPIEHIDPDALKVVRRLKRYGHTAYLVGGCVRDLLLGRTPKDFDIGTSARPRQVKHLFRNSRIIGRRFRLAHIVFGKKVIEVATFRATHEAPELPEEITGEVDLEATPSGGKPVAGARPGAPPVADKDEDDLLIKSDNVFGTPEQDAFRRDFTVNGLFYDPETQQVIDHVGGMADLERRVLRTIGDPEVRFKEDPVRIVRAVKFAARLQFAIEPKTFDAMIRYRQELAKAAPPRLAEEVIRLSQGGAGAESFRLLYELGVLQHIAPSVSVALARANEKATPDAGAAGLFWRHLEAIDRWPNGPMDLSRAVALSAVYGPVYRAALEENPQMAARDPGVLFFNAIRPAISERLLSRREADRMKLIYVAQRRLETAPGAGDGPMPPLAGEKPGQGGSNDPRRRRRRRGGGAKGLATRDYFREAVAFFRVDSMAKGKSPDVWERWEALLPQAPPTREVLPFRRREESMPLGAEPSEDEPLPTQQEIDAVNRLPDDEDFSQRGRRRRRGGGRVSNDNRERQRMARTAPGESGGVPETARTDAEFEGGPTSGGGIVERPSVETSALPKLTKPKRARERELPSVASEPAPPPAPKLSPSERIAAAMASDAPLINPYTNRAYVPRKVLDDMPTVAMAATATSAAAAAGAGLGMGVSAPIVTPSAPAAGAATTEAPYSLDEFEGDDDESEDVPDRPSNPGEPRPAGAAPAAPGTPRPPAARTEGPAGEGDGKRKRRRRGRRGRGRGGRPGEAGANATPAGGSTPAAAAPPRSEGNGGGGTGGGSAT